MSRPSTRSTVSRLSRPVAVATTALALAATATLTTGGPASSAPSSDCPDVFPTADLVRDQAVDGLTVSQGTTPDPFTGSVIGVLKDGIFPGVDMILVKLTSTEIDRVGGIWAGMSGSPVYAADGSLIGAVSYGLTYGSSPVAGVTPAADMQALMDRGALSRQSQPRQSVQLPRATTRQLVAGGELTQKQADGGFSRLKTPVGVSGVSASMGLKKINKQLGLKNVQLYAAGRAPAAAPAASPADVGIVAGGTLAAAISYGDFSAVGTGTATMVCGDQVVGFGHPFDWAGDSTMTMHGADTLYIQEDTTGSPFKVSNPTGPVGTVTQDRIAGIAGTFGEMPATTEITSTASVDGGSSRTGTTYTSMPSYTPDVAALANVYNFVRVLDEAGPGSSLVHFTVNGTTAGGEPFTVVRTNRFSSGWDIGYESAWDIYSTVSKLQHNKFTKVHIDSVETTADLSAKNQQYKVGKVEWKHNGGWKQVKRSKPIKASPGQKLNLRVTLTSFRNELGSKHVKLSVTVPDSAKRGRGAELLVSGGNSWWGGSNGKATTFDGLVSKLSSSARNDEVTASLEIYRRNAPAPSVDSARVNQVVGGHRWLSVKVK